MLHSDTVEGTRTPVRFGLLARPIMTKILDTSYYDKRRRGWLADEDTRAEYERARREIEQIDAVIRSLDELRQDAGISKAELARRVGRNPGQHQAPVHGRAGAPGAASHHLDSQCPGRQRRDQSPLAEIDR